LEWLGLTVARWYEAIRGGADFSMALMAILLTHECGHYFLARRYFINASPPYFLPAPYQVNFIGTFGAFIRLRSPIADRRQLMDVGAAGPWAGFVVSLVFLLVGLARSQVATGGLELSLFTPVLGIEGHGYGDSAITYAFRQYFFGDVPVLLHPLAIAGWFGVFITGLNLIPLGQLDGGHVLHALIGRRQGIVGALAWLGLLRLSEWFAGWLIWALLILLLSRGRIVHPSVVDRHRRLPASRVAYGWATMGLFLLTFTPAPLYFPISSWFR
jgi:membrane-associated protease RseP (regulator of RpoE activity)